MTEKSIIKCPICGKESDMRYKPFCSKRCADVDLNRWFSGSYIVHTDEKPDESFINPDLEEKN